MVFAHSCAIQFSISILNLAITVFVFKMSGVALIIFHNGGKIMFNNIGEKIKKLAIVATVLGMIASLIAAIIIWAGNMGVLYGIFVLVVGVVFSWISSFVLYGFGEVIIKLNEIEKDIQKLKATNGEQTDKPNDNQPVIS